MGAEIPEGFLRHSRGSPLTDPWQPLFSRILSDRIQIGLQLESPHTNSRGLMHGGLVATLADNAMGLSCLFQMEKDQQGSGRAPVTINLAVDYLGKAEIGQWIVFDPGFIRIGKSICFAQCFVSADGSVVARANATFKV